MIRVLQVGMGANPGGIENCVMRYFRRVNREEFAFDFADIYGGGLAYASEIRSLGGNIYIFSNYKSHPLQMMRDMSELLKSQRYDIIHIHALSAANLLPIFVACRSETARVIVHSHNASTPSGLFRKALNGINRFPLRRMPVEKWACGKMAGVWMWGKGFQEAHILPNAIETEQFRYDEERRSQMRRLCGYTERHTVIGFAGRLCEQKNILFLPEIMRELVWKSQSYRMLVIGDGDLKEIFLHKVRTMNLEDYVLMTGLQNDVSPWYQAMDGFVLPSFFEGLPIVGVEAQASGLPCFFSDTITTEINLTENASFLPIRGNDAAGIWAHCIHERVPIKKRNSVRFPEHFRIENAVSFLESVYCDAGM